MGQRAMHYVGIFAVSLCLYVGWPTQAYACSDDEDCGYDAKCEKTSDNEPGLCSPNYVARKADVVVNIVNDPSRWDGGADLPDISFCMSSGTHTIGMCDRELEYGWGAIVRTGGCRNTLRCVYSNITFKAEEYIIRIIDADWDKSDVIAEGTCKLPGPCEFEHATVEILFFD